MAGKRKAKLHKPTIDAVIHEIATGRTINNFGHVPEIVRALEWIIMDIRRLTEREKGPRRGKRE